MHAEGRSQREIARELGISASCASGGGRTPTGPARASSSWSGRAAPARSTTGESAHFVVTDPVGRPSSGDGKWLTNPWRERLNKA